MLVAVATPAAAQIVVPGLPPAEDTYISKLQSRLDAAVDRLRSTIESRKEEFFADHVIVKYKGEKHFKKILVKDGDVPSAISGLLENPEIESAEPDYVAHAFEVPNDPYYQYQWDLQAEGGVNAIGAWSESIGSGVTVAVVDTGIAYEDYGSFGKAPDLAATAFASGYDFVNDDSHPNDDNGHGTHVTGTIAESTGNGLGGAGVAYGATIMPIKVLDATGSGSYSAVADGIRWAADHGAKVINLSLGGSASASYLLDAVAYAYNKGVVIVAAAGNDGKSALSYPAAYNQYVIAVGATRFDKTRAYYSNFGTGLDVVAPGGDLRVDQNHDGYADGILEQTFTGSVTNFGYYFYQGTSMATPHVSGIAALVMSNGKATTTADVRKAIEATADDLGTTGWDKYYGYGLADAAKAVLYDPLAVAKNIAPTANAGSDKSAILNKSVNFDASQSADSDGTIVSYAWNFGDGTTGSGVSVGHKFTRTGTFTVKLTVTDNNGAVGTDTAAVTVTRR